MRTFLISWEGERRDLPFCKSKREGGASIAKTIQRRKSEVLPPLRRKEKERNLREEKERVLHRVEKDVRGEDLRMFVLLKEKEKPLLIGRKQQRRRSKKKNCLRQGKTTHFDEVRRREKKRRGGLPTP